MKPEKLRSALQHAGRGFRVLPVHSVREKRCTCRNEKCDSPGKHPRIKGWQKAATTNVGAIRARWRKWLDANIGIATGSGLVVLDIDPRNGGLESLNALESANAPLPPTLTARTGRGDGGRHLFFRSSDPVPNRELASGIDLQSDGKFVVAPGSQHVSGGTYEWEDSTVPIARLPAWVHELVASPRAQADHDRGDRAAPHQRPGAGIDWLSRVRTWLRQRYGSERIPDGRRRNTLLKKVAGLLRSYGLSGTEIVGILQSCNQELCDPPMREESFEKFGEWVEEKWPRGQPRDPEVEAQVTAVLAAARRSQWSGKAELSALKCLEATATLALQLGKLDISIGVRPLGLLAGMDPRTAAKARRLLCQREWLEPLTPSTHGRSSVFRLRLPPARANATYKHTRLGLAGFSIEETSTSSLQAGRSVSFARGGDVLDADQFRWRGDVGPVGRWVLSALESGPWPSAAELARFLGFKAPTVRRHLQRLGKQALAVKDATGWQRGPSQVAVTHDVRRRDALFSKAERLVYHEKLRRRGQVPAVPTPTFTKEEVEELRDTVTGWEQRKLARRGFFDLIRRQEEEQATTQADSSGATEGETAAKRARRANRQQFADAGTAAKGTSPQ